VKFVIQSDIDAVFANNSCLKIIETGFAEQFWGLQLCTDLFENLSVNSFKKARPFE
jgi:hypothetical protein